METTRLVQRLLKPYKNESISSSPFAFGGGYKNGGLTDEAMEILSKVFRFDYMGAAEFEFGAVPEALSKIYKNSKKYTTKEITVSYNYQQWRDKAIFTGKRKVYIICEKNKEDIETISKLIKSSAKDRDSKWFKCPTLLACAMSGHGSDFTGWLELNNGFFFFIDEEMFNKVCNIFKIKRAKKKKIKEK
jgi:hypothetical protein